MPNITGKELRAIYEHSKTITREMLAIIDFIKPMLDKEEKQKKDVPGQLVIAEVQEEKLNHHDLAVATQAQTEPKQEEQSEEMEEESWDAQPGELQENISESKRTTVPTNKPRTFESNLYSCSCGCDKLIITLYDGYGNSLLNSKCTKCNKEEQFKATEEDVEQIILKGSEILPKEILEIQLGGEITQVEKPQEEVLLPPGTEVPIKKKRGRPKKVIVDQTQQITSPPKPAPKPSLVPTLPQVTVDIGEAVPSYTSSNSTHVPAVDPDEEVFKYVPPMNSTPVPEEQEKVLEKPKDISENQKQVQEIINKPEPEINLEATQKELLDTVNSWPKEKIIKKYEELTQQVFQSYTSLELAKSIIVNALLGPMGESNE